MLELSNVALGVPLRLRGILAASQPQRAEFSFQAVAGVDQTFTFTASASASASPSPGVTN